LRRSTSQARLSLRKHQLARRSTQQLGNAASYNSSLGRGGEKTRLAQSVADIGQYTGLVFEQHEMDFALREANVRRLERAARYDDVIRENALEPAFVGLHSDPRFKALVRKVGLVT